MVQLLHVGTFAAVIIFTAIAAWASYTDIKNRIIPNISVLAVIGLSAIYMIGETPAAALSGLLAGLLALAIGIGFYAVKWMGAGDAKFFAATSLMIGMASMLEFGLVTAALGGLVAVVSVITRPQRAMIMMQMRGKGDYGRGVPYGVAIAVAGVIMLWARLLHIVLPTVSF